jgi:hypothetical protein
MSIDLEWPAPLPEIKLVSVDDIFIDERYQRPDDMKRAAKIAAHFLPESFVPPSVVENSEGKFEALDGNTRKNAAKLSGYNKIPVLVLKPENFEHVENKAFTFHLINTNRTNVNKLVQQKALATAQDPDAMAIQKMFTELGIELSQGRIGGKDAEPNKFRAIKIVMPMYRRNPDLLWLTFSSLKKVYNGAPQSLSMRIVGGTFRFLNLYHESRSFTFERFENTLRSIDINEFYTSTQDKHPEKFDKVVKMLVTYYNMTNGQRLRKSKFDD